LEKDDYHGIKEVSMVLFLLQRRSKMDIIYTDLVKSDKLEKRINLICSFNNANCEFLQGRILNVQRTNISFIEPHRINITIKEHKILILYYDEFNLFFFNRSIPIEVNDLYSLLKTVKEWRK